MHRLLPLCLLIALFVIFPPARAAEEWDWWPDPASKTGLAVFLSYSSEYEQYQDRDYVDQQVDAMDLEHVDVVFVQISSKEETPHLQRLSDKTDRFTEDVQYLLNQLAKRGIRGCVSIFSDFFKGTPDQMQKVGLVNHALDFNENRDTENAGFLCFATDWEMQGKDKAPPGFRNSFVYDQWKQFHIELKDRIAARGSDVKLVVWMQGPDFLIDKMDDPEDKAALMQREGITQVSDNPNLYSGAVKYFSTRNGVAIFKAIIPMWYFRTVNSHQRRLDHNVTELQDLVGDKPYLIAGVKVPTSLDDRCMVDPDPNNRDCLPKRSDYLTVLDYDDNVRINFSSFIGTAVFKWPILPEW